jgi:hypothetical protein
VPPLVRNTVSRFAARKSQTHKSNSRAQRVYCDVDLEGFGLKVDKPNAQFTDAKEDGGEYQ